MQQFPQSLIAYPDSKVHGANMGPIWGRQDPGGPHVGPMNFAIWVYIPNNKDDCIEVHLTFIQIESARSMTNRCLIDVDPMVSAIWDISSKQWNEVHWLFVIIIFPVTGHNLRQWKLNSAHVSIIFFCWKFF